MSGFEDQGDINVWIICVSSCNRAIGKDLSSGGILKLWPWSQGRGMSRDNLSMFLYSESLVEVSKASTGDHKGQRPVDLHCCD